MRIWKDSRKSRLIFVGSLIGSAGLVTLVTFWLTIPRFWPIVKETSVERAVKAGTGPAFWWPPSWREDYRTRKLYQIAIESLANLKTDLVVDLSYHPWDEWQFAISALKNVAAESNGESRLAVIRSMPEFALTDQDNRTVRSSDLRGKVALVSFIFTTCNGTCPATTHRMSLVHQTLKSRGLLKDGRVRLVSITLDPARDTPEVLGRYMQLYDLDAKHWSFLTGPAEDVDRTIAAWDMWVRPAANGQLDHPSRIFLVDPQARVREIYNLSFLKPDWVAEDVKLLLDETTR